MIGTSFVTPRSVRTPIAAYPLPVFVMLRRMQLTAWIASHAETPTAQALGEDYARGTVALGVEYLRRYALEPVL